MTVKIGLNGYGTIGKRVADAIAKQFDMKVVGVAKKRPDFKAQLAVKKGFTLYAADNESLKEFENSGLPTGGILKDLLEGVDLIVDTTPGGTGKINKDAYAAAGVKAVFEGGEKAPIADVSFVAQCNFDKAVGKRSVRVVSCNTTGLCRSLHALDQSFGVEWVNACLIRRGADPFDVDTGPINAIVLDPPRIPSHHGPDVQTVLPNLRITTMAVCVPTTLMHLHAVTVRVRKDVTKEDVLGVFKRTTRIKTVKASEGITSTAELSEYIKDLGRYRNDLYEIAVWEDSIGVEDKRDIYYFQAVHQEADVVPENVDAIRAMLNLASAAESIKTTNQTLGIA